MDPAAVFGVVLTVVLDEVVEGASELVLELEVVETEDELVEELDVDVGVIVMGLKVIGVKTTCNNKSVACPAKVVSTLVA